MVTMRSNTPEGKYTLMFRVSDRRHSQHNVSAIMIVTVKNLPHSSVRNSGSMQISGVSAEDFIREWQYMGTQMSKAQHLTNVLAEILSTDERNVEIFSIRQQGKQPPLLDIFFSVNDPKLHRRETITGLLQVHKEEITRKIGLNIVLIGINHCLVHETKCEGPCTNSYRPSKYSLLVDANTTSFVGVSVIVTPECQDITNESAHKSCHDHHCYNGGCCVQKGSSVSCICPVGYDGPRCQGTVRSFQGDGWAWFPSLTPQSENHVSLEFLTKEEHGLIFYNGPVSVIAPLEDSVSDFVAFEIYNGKPRLLLKTTQGTVELSVHVERNLNDGKWHHIDIFWNSVNVRLVVDFCKSADVVEMKEAAVVFFNGTSCQAERSLPYLNTQLNLNSPLQIGGIYWTQIPTKATEWRVFPKSLNFDGCIRNFFHNSQIVDLADPLLSVGTTTGCSHTKAACSQLNCTAHGTCLADLTGAAPQCWCDVGWSGPSCSVPTKPITFLPHSYIKFALSFELSHFTTVMQMRFKTEEVEGELFRLADQVSQEYAILEIRNGSLCFRYNLNSIHTEEQSVCLSYVNISDGNWHTVKISRYGSLSILQLDDGEFTRYNQTTSFEGHQLLVVDKQEGVHAGGKAEYLGMNTLEIFADYKNGCMDDIRLDGRVLPLPPSVNVTQWGQATAALNVEYGCGYSDCITGFCQEPLIYASEILNKYHCMCGSESTTLKPGADICNNPESGKCLYQHSKLSYKCVCPDDAEGVRHGFLQERHTFSLGIWILIVLLSAAVLFFVLGAMFIGYKYQCSTHETTEVKNDVQENVIFHADEGGGKDDTVSCSMKELKIYVDKIGPTESVEMHKFSEIQQNSEEILKNIIEKHKRETDMKILSDNLDHTCCYDFEGIAEASSSLSSLTTEYDATEEDCKDITKIAQDVTRV
ncbi:neural-cadherin-like [Schistocerca serialis cubense]|uniref:neural-cadherin-like n=1 Tax=Schistocerca serialis cubense TaxID=2023355 RepID=UPI00214EDB89|nr:neural-cadherin-like [Schistocerca serialis cubense]